MVIATKSNGIVSFDVNDRGLSRRHIIGQVETSLHRLETGCIDLYYAHDPDPDTPLEQTLAVYDDLIHRARSATSGCPTTPPGRSPARCESRTTGVCRPPSPPS